MAERVFIHKELPVIRSDIPPLSADGSPLALKKHRKTDAQQQDTPACNNLKIKNEYDSYCALAQGNKTIRPVPDREGEDLWGSTNLPTDSGDFRWGFITGQYHGSFVRLMPSLVFHTPGWGTHPVRGVPSSHPVQADRVA